MPKERAGGTRVMASACGPTMGACAAAIAGAVLVSNRLITNDFTVVVPVLGTLMLAAAGLGLFAPPVAVRRHAPGVRGRPRPDPQLTCVGAWFLNGLIWFLSATAVFGLLHLGPC